MTPRLVHVSDLETLFDRPTDAGRFAGTITALRDDRTAVVGTGDTTALGSLALATDEGRGHAAPFLDRIRPVADTFGNHDFDHGPEWTAEWARRTPGTSLAANLSGVDADAYDSHAIVEVGGTRVGLVGVANPETSVICAAAADLDFTDPVAAVREGERALREDGAEYVVALSHCGDTDATIARETDVDVVLGAHDHERVEKRVAGTLVARTRGGQANEFEVVTLGETPTVDVREPTGPEDEEITEEYRERRDAAGIDELVCSFAADLSPAETGWGVADAYRVRGNADVGITAEASVRGALPAEPSVGDLLGAVPFDSALQTLEIRGEDLEAAVLAGREPLDDTHGRLHVAGAAVDGDTVFVGGEPVEDRTYRVACTSYLPSVDLLPGFTPDRVVADHGLQHEHLLAHARNGQFGPGTRR